MNILYLTHALDSCWNHGNAHFLRGVLRALAARGHQVLACQPRDAWSRENLLRDHGCAALEQFRACYPELRIHHYDAPHDLESQVAWADAVIVHEWNTPELVAWIGRARRQLRFTLLFHDTHHRAVSDPEAMRRFDLDAYDGVLAFGASLAEIYRSDGWGSRAFTWHEAADTTLFAPPARPTERHGLVWIGNWGDGERGSELAEFLLRPASEAGLSLDVHGVRYPPEALAALAEHGARYRGWLPNTHVPEVFARSLATVHVPRRFYAETLPGIPTIRMFEALACGIPLVSAPWDDLENLFRAGVDHLRARDGAEMSRHLRALAHEPALRESLAAEGLATITARHTCDHRAAELLGILDSLRAAVPVTEVAA